MQSNRLDLNIISRVRRNHGLEHATINLLSKKLPAVSFYGRSDAKGFWINGNVSTDLLLETVQEALKRLKGGEKGLAVHENCGTNVVTAGVIAGTLAWLGSLGKANNFKKKLDRWGWLVMLVTGGLILAQPLGPKVQEHVTTSGDPGDLAVKQIVRYEGRVITMHRILTADERPAVETAV